VAPGVILCAPDVRGGRDYLEGKSDGSPRDNYQGS